ncbi:unnamed protein product, partial [Enterobius vermicularis]|uniref:G-patch domain-containing protein n=1 Tax=Enterobius vermicularis TaxID=51028 RepID=A0A0N4VF01_ENTVE
MSILAEPRRKQRISIDPRNLAWKNDKGNFGRVMLEKMGWKPGKGLGREERGPCENLKLNFNASRKGMDFYLCLGCSSVVADTWVEHHDDFEKLLAFLNKKKSNPKSEECSRQQYSLEQQSKLSKARVHYQKSARSKDVAQYSEQDKVAVLGPMKPSKNGNQKRKVEELSEAVLVDTSSTVQSELSMKDYFAKKSKRLKSSLGPVKNKGKIETIMMCKHFINGRLNTSVCHLMTLLAAVELRPLRTHIICFIYQQSSRTLHNSDKYSVELWARSAVLSVKLAELSELLALFVEWSVLVDFDHMKSNKRSSIQVYIGYVYNLLDKSADKLVDTAVLEHRIDTVTPPEDSYNTSELKVPRGRKCMTKSS